jgi:hypothetical protein
VPKGLAVLAVRTKSSGTRAMSSTGAPSAHTSQSSIDQSKTLTTADAAATLLPVNQCADGNLATSTTTCTSLSNALANNGVDTTPGPQGIPGTPGTPGDAGQDAGTSLTSRASFTSNPPIVFSKYMAVSGDPAKIGTAPLDVAQVSAAVPTKAQAVTASVIGPWPSRAATMIVTLVINDVGVSVTGLTCTLTAAQPMCTAPGPKDVPAGARLAWAVNVITQPVTPPATPTPVEDFDLSVGFETTTA